MKYFIYPLLLLCTLLTACGTQQHTQSDIPEGGYRRLVVTSSTHVGFLCALGAEDRIVGMCDPQYCYHRLPNVQDVGSSITLDPERILAVGADAVLLSNYGTSDKNAAMLRELGITPIAIDEWREDSPLARASWIKRIGALVGKEHEADSIYQEVERQYNALKNAQTGVTSQLSILSGAAWQGTWYVPGGRTYMAELFRDAGARYAYENDTTHASLPLSFEQALVMFRDADVWLGAPTATLDELRAQNEKHTWFRAYQTGNVYHFRKRMTPSGANDFWESGVVHPEYILSDLVHILHHDPDSLMIFAGRLQ